MVIRRPSMLMFMRTFIAIEIPDEAKREIAKVQDQLKDLDMSASWTRPEGIHLTLKFLGEVPEAKVPEIMDALAITAGTGALRIEIAGAGAFPNAKSPRVIWSGVAGEVEKLTTLQAAVEDAMRKLGFEAEARKFSPHLTLARIKFPRRGDDWQNALERVKDAAVPGFLADRLSLMKSELKREGAVYTEIGNIDL